MLKCPKCGGPVADGETLCPVCGWDVTKPVPASEPEPREPALSAAELWRQQRERRQEQTKQEQAPKPEPAHEPDGQLSAAELWQQQKQKEEAERLAREEQALRESRKAGLLDQARQAEEKMRSFEKKAKPWLIIALVCVLLTVVGVGGAFMNSKTTTTEHVQKSDFLPWSGDTESGDGTTFTFNSLVNFFTMTTTMRLTSGTVSNISYTAYYLVANEAGDRAVLYASISAPGREAAKLAAFFPEVEVIDLGTTGYPVLPSDPLTAYGAYTPSRYTLDYAQLDSSSKLEYAALKGYPFIDLDKTSITRTVPIPGAEGRQEVFRIIGTVAAIAAVVSLIIRRRFTNLAQSHSKLAASLRFQAERV